MKIPLEERTKWPYAGYEETDITNSVVEPFIFTPNIVENAGKDYYGYDKTLAANVFYNPPSSCGMSEEELADTINRIRNADTRWMADLAPVFLEMENEYGIDARFLVGLAVSEGGLYNSGRVASQNNLFGAKYHDSYTIDLSSGKFGIYASKEDSIRAIAERLDEDYFNPDSSYCSLNADGSIDMKHFIQWYVCGPYDPKNVSELQAIADAKIEGFYEFMAVIKKD